MAYVALQWLFFLITGLGLYPKAHYLFRYFPDRGYAFSKILGWLLFGYLNWFMVSLGPIEYGLPGLILVFTILVLVPPGSLVAFFWKPARETGFSKAFSELRSVWKLALLLELIFFGLLHGYALVRSYRPDIHGAEKMMDFAFLSSIVRTVQFPPPDPWFAGSPINYYYFGYYLCSLPIKLLGIPEGIGYNLSIATLASLVFILSLSLGLYLTGRWIYALISSLTVAIVGNYDGLLQLMSGTAVSAIDIWRSSRVIDKTINEFPAFSFLFADLHGHVMAIPLVLLLIALIAILARADMNDSGSSFEKDTLKHMLFTAATAGLGLACLLMTNIWDVPIYSVFLLLVLLLTETAVKPVRSMFPRPAILHFGDSFVLKIVLFGMIIIAAMIFAAPFLFHYQGQQQGLGIVKERSDFFQFIIHYGFLLLVCLTCYVFRFKARITEADVCARDQKRTIIVVSFIFIMIYLMLKSMVLLLLFLLCSFILNQLLYRSSSQNTFGDIITMTGLGLLLACEVIFIRDFYGGQPRMNTVFKFGYQAWILLSVAVGPMLAEIFRYSRQKPSHSLRNKILVVLVIVYLPLSVFSVFGTYSYSLQFKPAPCLDGTRYIERYHGNDAAAISWLKNQPGIRVLLEAPGDSYQYHSVYSTFSGHSSVLGWQQHEALWRDWTWATIKDRVADIETIFQGREQQLLQHLLRKYTIDYIIFGPHEMSKYGNSTRNWLNEHFRVVFKQGDVTIFQAS